MITAETEYPRKRVSFANETIDAYGTNYILYHSYPSLESRRV